MSNYYLLYGTDKGVIDNELHKILKNINSNDVTKYSMDSVSIKDIISDVSTISMFGDRRILIVDNAYFFLANKKNDSINELEEYINKANTDNYLIFIAFGDKVDTRKKIYKLFNSKGKIISCNKGDSNYIYAYVREYLDNNKYKMDDINYFISIVGNDLGNITNELDKLFIYKVDDKVILKEDIDKVCIKVLEDEIFSLTDAIILNDTSKAMMLLEEFLNKNYDEIYILNLLASQFRFLYQVKRLVNKNNNYNEIAKILEVNPYRVKFSLSKLYNYTEKDLIDRIKSLGKIDKNIKLGLMNKRLALELFVLEE